MTGAVLDNPGNIACRPSGAEVAGDVICDAMTVTRGVRLTGARVGSRLSLDHVEPAHGAGTVLSARAIVAGQLSLRPAGPIHGAVSLSYAHVELSPSISETRE